MENATQKYIDTIAYLGRLYDHINAGLFENALSKPVITVQRDERNKTYGWWSVKKVWHENADESEHELNITAQGLARPIGEIAATLIHEMCHQFASVNGIKDTSRSHIYHNAKYKEIAEAHGLKVEKAPAIGWSVTSLTETTAAMIADYTAENPPAILYRDMVTKGQTKKASNTRKYVCPRCGQSIRATKEVNIICADCNEKMIEE